MGRQRQTAEVKAMRQPVIGTSVPSDLPAPDRLRDHGKECWRKLLLRLHTRLTEKDLHTLEAYCMAWQTLLEADDQLNGELWLYTEKGPQKHPLVEVYFSALGHVATFTKKLGLEPLTTGTLAPPSPTDQGETTESILADRRTIRFPQNG